MTLHFPPAASPAMDGRISPPAAATVWLADLTHTQQLISADAMPAAIGGIATFAEAQVPLVHPIRLFKYPEALADALERDLPDVIGFSNYLWNFRLAYRFATVIKRLSPRTIVVFGGPNYPIESGDQEAFLRRHPYIDFYVVKEGEVGFASLLASLVDNGLDALAVKDKPFIPSVHWIRPDGKAALSSVAPRLQDLAAITSPYLSGRLDEFFDGKLIPVLQTNRGCPFYCTFCVEGTTYYNKVYANSSEKVAAEIDYIGSRMARVHAAGGRNDLLIADSNFGMFKQDLDTCRALAVSMERHGWPDYISCNTGKNQKERTLEAARLVKGALRLSGSVQSLDPTVLKNIKRTNISEDELLNVAMKGAEVGANSYSEIILGLPGDSRKAHLESLRAVVDAGFKLINTWQLMLLPGSELNARESREQYGMVTRFRVLPRCYGHFTVRGQSVSAAEIEEICVATNTLPFEDYLWCRKLHLIIGIFFNDGILSSLAKLLKLLGMSVFSWLEVAASYPVEGALKDLFESFERQTRDELWDSLESLAAFTDRTENIERYIKGECGHNVLYFHKAVALTDHVPELMEFAGRTVRTVLEQAGQLNDRTEAFVVDALTYSSCRVTNIFFDRHAPVRATLRHDLPAFERSAEPGSLERFRLPEPVEYAFVQELSQEDSVATYLRIYGANVMGVSRILMRVYPSKLFRHPVTMPVAMRTSADARSQAGHTNRSSQHPTGS